MIKTETSVLARPSFQVAVFVWGLVLIFIGILLFNPGRTVMQCQSYEEPGFYSIEGFELIVTDGCNRYDIPLLSIAGAVLSTGAAVGTVTWRLYSSDAYTSSL
jgi:hypothetical protein